MHDARELFVGQDRDRASDACPRPRCCCSKLTAVRTHSHVTTLDDVVVVTDDDGDERWGGGGGGYGTTTQNGPVMVPIGSWGFNRVPPKYRSAMRARLSSRLGHWASRHAIAFQAPKSQKATAARRRPPSSAGARAGPCGAASKKKATRGPSIDLDPWVFSPGRPHTHPFTHIHSIHRIVPPPQASLPSGLICVCKTRARVQQLGEDTQRRRSRPLV